MAVRSSTQHILSFDVENWFDGNLHRRWTHQPGRRDERLVSEVADLLDILERHRVTATFFILGTVATDHPDVVRRIAAAGHEVGSHSWTHEMIGSLTPERYLSGLVRSRKLLQDLSGQPILGHRAPSWSLDRRVAWAVDCLQTAGFTYDSSVFPMRTPLYGVSGFPTSPCWLAAGGARMLEFPPAVRHFGPLPAPFGGGLYWRLLPAWSVKFLLGRATGPEVTYLHPWELNSDPLALPPDLPVIPRVALRYGVGRARQRLIDLLGTYSFGPFAPVIPLWTNMDGLPTVSWEGE